MRRAALVTVVAVVAVLFAAVAPTAGADSAGRLRELTLHSDGVGDVDVRILLPAGYDDPARAATRYPVLYLLHGMSGDETDWTDLTDVEELTAPHDLIVVMPDGGRDGFYSDWLVGPQWETFHIGELIPFVDENYRTVATRQARAIAGLSMGGYGAMVYAARHPDLFVAAASFSGAVDIADLGAVEGIGLELLLNAGPRWGPFVTNEINWRDHNPPDLGTNLRGMRVDIFAGNGVPRAGDNALSTPVEVATYTMSTALHVRLRADGVAHGWHDYGPGTHEWHYWQADLHQWLPIVLATFAAPPSRPEAFDYRTARPSFSVDDWSFTVERAAREFVDLTGVSVSGLTLRGSGAVDVVTPPSYEPGATYEVAVRQASGPVSPGDIVGPLSSVKARAPRA
ncbi:MAG: alpha/beta hydrolase, partial [Acidimicrobiales bacterium]